MQNCNGVQKQTRDTQNHKIITAVKVKNRGDPGLGGGGAHILGTLIDE